MSRVKVELPDGKIIERKLHAEQMGNFQMLWITYKGDRYLIGDGDEYLRGMPEVFKLGRKIED